MSIQVTQSSIAPLEEYIEEIRPIFESKWMTNMGPIYKKLQAQLKDYLQVPELSMFVNGHMALEMALQAFDFPEGSEVITTPFTFISTTHAIARSGLVPVFCDIYPDDYTMDVSKIEALITEKTVAIVPVHVYGNLCDVEGIQEVADRHGLKVLYDGAHAFGTSYKGTTVGNFGDMCMFSFHATKVFNTIEGGAVSFRDMKYAERLHELKNYGIHGETQIENIGANAKMDEFRAAMGVCNLRYVDADIEKRYAVAQRYGELLGGVPGIRLLKFREGVKTNYSYYPVCFDPSVFKRNREQVLEALQAEDINGRRYFYPISNELDCYRSRYKVQETPVAREVSQNILCLPMYADLALEDVERICRIILA